MKNYFILAFWALPALLIAQSVTSFPPKNEIDRDPSLSKFVAQLRDAVQKEEAATLNGLLANDIQTSLDKPGTLQEFKRLWKYEYPMSRLWFHLGRALQLGGVYTGRNDEGGKFVFAFPYVYKINLPQEEYSRVAVVVNKNANLHLSPNIQSKVLAQISYEVVQYDARKPEGASPMETTGRNAAGEPEWYYVKTSDNKHGWMLWSDLYSPLGYRVYLGKRNGEWKVTCLTKR